MTGAAPTGTVTFLFTDIQGSTSLVDALRERYADVLERHRQLVLGAVADRRGHHMGFEGDACFVVFARASDAVAAAIDVQRALGEERWDGPRVRVRIGVHTGEAQLTAAGYVGMAAHQVARVRSAAHGGQILISGSTAELVAGALPEGALLIDLGAHRLKDLGQPARLYQVAHPDLDADFPPPTTLDSLPNNLPIQLTSFVGRDREVDELERLVGAARLVTVLGPGGSGKTRLALHVAANLLDRNPEGVWFVDLAATTDGAAIPDTLVSVLGSRRVMPGTQDSGPSRTPLERLAGRLGSGRALLVLDNCEHLLADCGAVAEALLRSCPGVSILATSREPLRVPGEARWRLAPLAVPDGGAGKAATTFDSVRLFVDRARLHDPSLALTPEHTGAVVDICRRLEGMPLAIELAAAWTGMLTPGQILDRLDDQFRLLATASTHVEPRQQTLRATVDWSYDLLTDSERRVLENLSVFAGGFSLDAAEYVASGDGVDRDDVLAVLSSLVDKSLVLRGGEGELERYRLLEVIRQYAWEKVTRAPDAQAVTGMARFTREGEYWTIGITPTTARLRHSKGLGYLRTMIEAPGLELHVLELSGDMAVVDSGAGELLDDAAKDAYKQRLAELEADLEEARAWSDTERAAAVEDEIDFLVAELSRAFGLGGRHRPASSSSERARTRVNKAIAAAIQRIEDQDPVLGGHLRAAVRTGTYCCYRPDPTNRVTWSFEEES